MDVQILETYSLSEDSVKVLKFLGSNEGMYTFYSNDHTARHPFEEHEANYLKESGFVKRHHDYNFGDVTVYLTPRGRVLLDAIKEQEGKPIE